MVRSYASDPVDEASLRRIAAAALRAPSAGDSQAIGVVVVTDPAARRDIARLAGEDEYVSRGFDPWISRAPAHIVISVSERIYRDRYSKPDKSSAGGGPADWPVPYWWVDAGAAMMAVLLAAVDEGLAAGFLGAHSTPGLADLLGLDEHRAPIGVITVGRPADEPRPARPGRTSHPKRAFEITSPSNDRIRRLVGLRDRRRRESEGVFLVEGLRLIKRAVRSGLEPVELYTDLSVDVSEFGDAVTVAPKAMDRASYRHTSQGVIAVFEQFPLDIGRLDPGGLVLAAEAVEKPGNLGAMLRTADAVGAAAMVAVGAVDPFNPNVIRASTGALFSVPVAVCDLEAFVDWLGAVPLVATAPDAPLPYWDHDFALPAAIMVGAEDAGLSEAARAAASAVVSIPMKGLADSLNASVSLALPAYEAIRRQRR